MIARVNLGANGGFSRLRKPRSMDAQFNSPQRGGRRYMSMKRKMVLPLALALGALGLMVMAQMASATHPRPKGATPLRVSTVPAFKQCTAPNRTHGLPLGFPSCNPPVQTSNYLTVGS